MSLRLKRDMFYSFLGKKLLAFDMLCRCCQMDKLKKEIRAFSKVHKIVPISKVLLLYDESQRVDSDGTEEKIAMISMLL